MVAVAAELAIDDAADAVPRARNAVREAFGRTHPQIVADVALVVTELVTNAVLHGRPPVTLLLLKTDDGIRVEVHDGSAQPPVVPQRRPTSMTGRGLALVTELCSTWGVAPRATGAGKVVWAEVPAHGVTENETGRQQDFSGLDVDMLLAQLADDQELEDTFAITIGPAPTELLLDAKGHIDNLVREFTLEDAAVRRRNEQTSAARVPADLAKLVTTVVHSFSVVRNAIKRQATAAARRGEAEVVLTLALPASAADAGDAYLEALDEADRYARNERLLSLETPAVHQVFRRWYVSALIDQVRAAAAGQPAPSLVPWPQHLAQAFARVAPLEEQAARLAALQRVTAHLTAATSVEEIGRVVAQSALDVLGANSVHVYVSDDGAIHTVANVGNFDATIGAQYEQFPLDTSTPAGAALVSGQVVVARDRQTLLDRFPNLEGSFPHELSLLVAPMTLGEERVGVLSATFSGAARIEAREQREFLCTLADVAAQAIERAKASRAAADANERLQFLAQASVVLSSTLEYKAVLESIANLLVPRLADWCSIQLAQDGQLVPVAIAHVDPDKVRWAWELNERYPTDMSAASGAPQVLRTGGSEMYRDIPAELLDAAAVDDEHRRMIRQLGIRSGMTVPLTGRTGILGVITLIMAESGRRYDDADVSLAEDLARRAALAVENADAYRTQTGRLASVLRVAEAAQHAILSPPPEQVGCVNLAARYVSAAAEALIGGDLYEVVRRPGAVRLLIGDVRGKGLDAVRTATIVLGEFRSAAADTSDLSDVAVRVDRRVREYLQPEDFITALMVEVRDDGQFTVACCGHPAPLRVGVDGVRAVVVEPTVPLGLGSTPTLTGGQLHAGDRLLLFTDGILEARDPQRRFVDLMALAQPLRHGELAPALDGVLTALREAVGGALGDDLALLIAQWRPEQQP